MLSRPEAGPFSMDLLHLGQPHCLSPPLPTTIRLMDWGIFSSESTHHYRHTMRERDSGFQGQMITSPEMVRPKGSEFPEIRHQRPTICGPNKTPYPARRADGRAGSPDHSHSHRLRSCAECRTRDRFFVVPRIDDMRRHDVLVDSRK